MPQIACSPRHRWCGHVKAGDTLRKTAQIMLKWRACCLLPARRANGWRRRKPLIPRERRTAWRSCAGQRKHHEYFVSSRQTRSYYRTERYMTRIPYTLQESMCLKHLLRGHSLSKPRAVSSPTTQYKRGALLYCVVRSPRNFGLLPDDAPRSCELDRILLILNRRLCCDP